MNNLQDILKLLCTTKDGMNVYLGNPLIALATLGAATYLMRTFIDVYDKHNDREHTIELSSNDKKIVFVSKPATTNTTTVCPA